MKTTNVVTLFGVGWTISYQSSSYGRLSNHLPSPHESGNVSNLSPLLGMLGWESAYQLDYKPVGRSKNIEAFFSSINWDTLDKRLVV
jgi:superoxide dismutase